MGASLARRIAGDILVWFCLPVLFMILYVGHFGLSLEAVLPHFRLVLLGWLTVAVCRALLSVVFRAEGASRVACAFVTSLALLVLVSYYGAVLTGLQSWGQVISWELISSYAIQLPALADALGLSTALIGLAFLVLFGLVFAAVWTYVRWFDWTWPVKRHTSGWLFAMLICASLFVVVIELMSFPDRQAGRQDEPVGLTVFPRRSARMLQDHSIDRLSAEKIDALQDQARSNYDDTVQGEFVNLILIVVDALRPDHLGVYGYSRDTTPTLSQLARNGQMRVIKGVHASCTESACGLMSLATSKYVYEFSDRPVTLHETLRRHGYAVHLILGGDHTNFYGLREAYGQVDSYFDGANASGYSNDDRFVVDRAAALPPWNGKPVMFQFHLMSAHVLGKRHEESLKYAPSANYSLPRYRKNASRQQFENYYDNGVIQADKMIASLLDVLAKKEYLKRALVVITADHGESLGEHGLYVHANSVRESNLRIPLLFIPYGYESKIQTPRANVAQIDISPTILTDLGMTLPASWTGVALQVPDTRTFSYFQQKQETGLIDARDPLHLRKYWTDRRRGTEYAFDLSGDPQENSNVIEVVAPQMRQEWRAALLKLGPTSNWVP